MKKILLITDEPKLEAKVTEALAGWTIIALPDAARATAWLKQEPLPNLIIIDFELKSEDGLAVFKKLLPPVKVIMLAASGSIPLAVSAAKLGVSEFLRKPFDAKELKQIVEKCCVSSEVTLKGREKYPWLSGQSPVLVRFFGQLASLLIEDKPVLLISERGVPKGEVTEFIHFNSRQQARRFVRINLTAFNQEPLVGALLTTLQELTYLPSATTLQALPERCGTLYLEGFDLVDPVIRETIANFFVGRQDRLDRSIRWLVGVGSPTIFQPTELANFSLLTIPPLRERLADLPAILSAYLKPACLNYKKAVTKIDLDLLAFLSIYDYPGNYQELADLVAGLVLAANSQVIGLAQLPLSFNDLCRTAVKQALKDKYPLVQAQRGFEQQLTKILLQKTGQDTGPVARYLDISKIALCERLEDLFD